MVLSGYLFARLTEGKKLLIAPFLYNRFMRLAPLMIAVILVRLGMAAWDGFPVFQKQLKNAFLGVALPTWPNGGWSITAEMHFYLLFPLLLVVMRKRPVLLLGFVVAAIAVRYGIYEFAEEKIRRVAYNTIVGRIDQFVIGMLFAQIASRLAGKHLLAAAVGLIWLFVYSSFVDLGGFYGNVDDRWVWIIMSTSEALAYGTLIAWYDQSFAFSNKGLSGLIARVGEWSFSIYLLHRFFVTSMAQFVNAHIVRLDNLYVAFAFAIPCFAIVCVPCWLSYEHFEKRFLRNRRRYLVSPKGKPDTSEAQLAPAAAAI